MILKNAPHAGLFSETPVKHALVSVVPSPGKVSFSVTSYINRRSLLRGGAGVALLGASSVLLAACGDDDSSPSSSASGAAKSFGALSYQLSWVKNVEFAGA